MVVVHTTRLRLLVLFCLKNRHRIYLVLGHLRKKFHRLLLPSTQRNLPVGLFGCLTFRPLRLWVGNRVCVALVFRSTAGFLFCRHAGICIFLLFLLLLLPCHPSCLLFLCSRPMFPIRPKLLPLLCQLLPISHQELPPLLCQTQPIISIFKSNFNNNNNVYLSCAQQRPERSHGTY